MSDKHKPTPMSWFGAQVRQVCRRLPPFLKVEPLGQHHVASRAQEFAYELVGVVRRTGSEFPYELVRYQKVVASKLWIQAVALAAAGTTSRFWP